MEQPSPVELADSKVRTDSDYFSAPDIKDFQCPICIKVPLPDQAYEHFECGMIFCHSCAKAVMNMNNEQNEDSCPVCKKPNFQAHVRNIQEQNKMLYQLICSLELKCPSNTVDEHEEKCEWSGIHSMLKSHYENDCINTALPCKYNSNEKIRRAHMNLHLTSCKFRPVLCQNCNELVPFHTLLKHQSSQDGLICKGNKSVLQTCKFEFIGCQFKGDSIKMSAHVKDIVFHLPLLNNKLKFCIDQRDGLSKTLKSLQTKIEMQLKYVPRCPKGHKLINKTKHHNESQSQADNIELCFTCKGDISKNKVIMECLLCRLSICEKCSSKGNSKYQFCPNNIEDVLIPFMCKKMVQCYKCRNTILMKSNYALGCPKCKIFVCPNCTKKAY